MENFTKKRITTKVVTSITCSVCKKTFDVDDFLEAGEFHTIIIHGGYGSVFGDCSSGRLDICQHCLKERLGEFIEWVER